MMKKSRGYRMAQTETTQALLQALESTRTDAARAGTAIEPYLDTLDVQRGATQGWRTSVSALLETLGCRSTPKQRQAIAKDLGFTGNLDAMGTLGIWLHGELMMRLHAEVEVPEAETP